MEDIIAPPNQPMDHPKYCKLFKQNLKAISNLPDGGPSYCLTQTPEQLKTQLVRANNHLDLTLEALNEMKKLQDLKNELSNAYGMTFEY